MFRVTKGSTVRVISKPHFETLSTSRRGIRYSQVFDINNQEEKREEAQLTTREGVKEKEGFSRTRLGRYRLCHADRWSSKANTTIRITCPGDMVVRMRKVMGIAGGWPNVCRPCLSKTHAIPFKIKFIVNSFWMKKTRKKKSNKSNRMNVIRYYCKFLGTDSEAREPRGSVTVKDRCSSNQAKNDEIEMMTCPYVYQCKVHLLMIIKTSPRLNQ